MNLKPVPYDTQLHFFDLFEGKISVERFEDWLYKNTDLEIVLGEMYLSLIILDYKDFHIIDKVIKASESILDFSFHEKRQLISLLNSLLKLDNDFPHYLKLVYDNDHHPLLSSLALQIYGLTFEAGVYYDTNWKDYNMEKRHEIVQYHIKEMESEINSILKEIYCFDFTGDFARNKDFLLKR